EKADATCIRFFISRTVLSYIIDNHCRCFPSHVRYSFLYRKGAYESSSVREVRHSFIRSHLHIYLCTRLPETPGRFSSRPHSSFGSHRLCQRSLRHLGDRKFRNLPVRLQVYPL